MSYSEERLRESMPQVRDAEHTADRQRSHTGTFLRRSAENRMRSSLAHSNEWKRSTKTNSCAIRQPTTTNSFNVSVDRLDSLPSIALSTTGHRAVRGHRFEASEGRFTHVAVVSRMIDTTAAAAAADHTCVAHRQVGDD
jgi:hypothetical protein